MSEWRLVRLAFGQNVAHFGELGIGIEETSERIRSDTLFSAWLSAYARLFTASEINTLIERFKTDPPFRLSSTFIYQQINGKLVDYLPRPLAVPPHYPKSDDLELVKTYKTLKHIPLEIWKRWYQGEGFSASDRDELSAKTTGKATATLARSGAFRYQDAFEVQRLPKIAVDRITRATNLYHTGIVQYRCEQNGHGVESLSGLYFLVEFLDPALEKLFFIVLDFLGEEGIGGERSSGAGRFTVKGPSSTVPDDWKSVITFNGGTYYCLMSLFWQHSLSPNLLEDARYELLERGGWISSPSDRGKELRRKSVRMFAEGSVFKSKMTGALADVTPAQWNGHPIYRSGISLSLPVHVQNGA
jgi:CRISPR-associated protein Csm4